MKKPRRLGALVAVALGYASGAWGILQSLPALTEGGFEALRAGRR
jgi:hypothetical protein